MYIFFPRRLDPILDGGEGNKNTVVPPEMPTGGAVGKAVIDDESNGKFDDRIGIVRLEWSDVGGIDIEMFVAFAAIVVRESQDDFDGTISIVIAEVSE